MTCPYALLMLGVYKCSTYTCWLVVLTSGRSEPVSRLGWERVLRRLRGLPDHGCYLSLTSLFALMSLVALGHSDSIQFSKSLMPSKHQHCAQHRVTQHIATLKELTVPRTDKWVKAGRHLSSTEKRQAIWSLGIKQALPYLASQCTFPWQTWLFLCSQRLWQGIEKRSDWTVEVIRIRDSVG